MPSPAIIETDHITNDGETAIAADNKKKMAQPIDNNVAHPVFETDNEGFVISIDGKSIF